MDALGPLGLRGQHNASAKEHHPGCVWDTRSDAASAGLRACFSGGVLALEVFADAQLIPVLADETVPLSTWVHLAVQRRGRHLEFFLNGSPAGNATVPGLRGLSIVLPTS